tara:strand:- start:694 stop:921 length:228 start_codon:yes stop_codon:yes gene_type:complete
MSSKDDYKFNYYLNSEKSYEWYYNIKDRMMIRLTSGTVVAIYSRVEDERGRIVVVTEDGDYIYADKEVVIKSGSN